MEIISFEIKSNFGFFNTRENKECNDTFLSIHPPAILGLLGSIIGLKGYHSFKENKKLEYLDKLKDIKINIEILNKNIETTSVKFSDTNKILFKGTALFIENCLVNPYYKIRLILDNENKYHLKLKEFLLYKKAVYNQYLGRTQFITSPTNVKVELYEKDGVATEYVGIHPKENSFRFENQDDFELNRKEKFNKNISFVIPTSIDYDDFSGVLYNKREEVSFDGPYKEKLRNGLVLFKEDKAFYFF